MDHNYLRERGQLLRAAAWNAYVERRGLNAQDGARQRKANQRALAALRAARRQQGVAA